MDDPDFLLARAHHKRKRLARPRLLPELVLTAFGVTAVLLLFSLLTTRFVVQGPSMQPNLHAGEFLLGSPIPYWLREPAYGDVIVFHFPESPDQNYIKRVVGVPGDTIELRTQVLYRNGERLEERYLAEVSCNAVVCPDMTWEIETGTYFVLGDNRNHSLDSRVFGAIPSELVVGQVLLRYYPLPAFTWLPPN